MRGEHGYMGAASRLAQQSIDDCSMLARAMAWLSYEFDCLRLAMWNALPDFVTRALYWVYDRCDRMFGGNRA